MERKITPMPRVNLLERFIRAFTRFVKNNSKEAATKVRLTVYKMPDATYLARISAPGKLISEPPGGIAIFSITATARDKEDLERLKRKTEKKATQRGITELIW